MVRAMSSAARLSMVVGTCMGIELGPSTNTRSIYLVAGAAASAASAYACAQAVAAPCTVGGKLLLNEGQEN